MAEYGTVTESALLYA